MNFKRTDKQTAIVFFAQENGNRVLLPLERGKYFRIAADVIVDGESLADMLIEAGMAVRYDGGKKTHKWCGENE